jgi:hypothetical protein
MYALIKFASLNTIHHPQDHASTKGGLTMKNQSLKGILVEKPWVKILVLTIITLTVLCGLFFVNVLWGNPIRKQTAKSRCLDYYQDQYQELFIVHENEYWNKLPGYVLTLSPESDPQIQFKCNPNCEPLCYTDEYGGKLASLLLVEQIRATLEPSYAHLALQVNAAEDPYTVFSGENPDYFETDPHIRLTKNHQDLNISWVDPTLAQNNFERIAEDIVGLIEAQLPVINPDLQITIAVFRDSTRQVTRYEQYALLFSTINLEE